MTAGPIRRASHQLPEFGYFTWIYTELDLVDLHIRLGVLSTATGVTFMKKWLLFSDFSVQIFVYLLGKCSEIYWLGFTQYNKLLYV